MLDREEERQRRRKRRRKYVHGLSEAKMSKAILRTERQLHDGITFFVLFCSFVLFCFPH